MRRHWEYPAVDERHYRILKYTALAMVLAWVGWTIYDGFVRPRDAEMIAMDAAHKAFADGQHERARHAYAEVLEKNPGHLEARRGLARTLLQLERYGEALRHFDRVIAAAPDYGATYANRGILYDRMGEYRNALADYRRAMELDPELDEGPGWLTLFLRNEPQPPPTIGDRAAYLEQELAKPADERVLRVPEEDERQQSWRVEK